MATAAFYDIKTGFISGTINPPLSNQQQIKDLETKGTGHIIIPDGRHGGLGMIDLETKTYKDFLPAPALPSTHTQLIASLIKNKVISKDDFHPVTLNELNNELKNGNCKEI